MIFGKPLGTIASASSSLRMGAPSLCVRVPVSASTYPRRMSNLMSKIGMHLAFASPSSLSPMKQWSEKKHWDGLFVCLTRSAPRTILSCHKHISPPWLVPSRTGSSASKPTASSGSAPSGTVPDPRASAGGREISIAISMGANSPSASRLFVLTPAKKMQVPTVGAWKRLESVCVLRFPLQPTRGTASCCILMRGKHVSRCSMTLVRGGSIGLGAKAMAEDFGQQFDLDLETDSSVAKGVATRRGRKCHRWS